MFSVLLFVMHFSVRRRTLSQPFPIEDWNISPQCIGCLLSVQRHVSSEATLMKNLNSECLFWSFIYLSSVTLQSCWFFHFMTLTLFILTHFILACLEITHTHLHNFIDMEHLKGQVLPHFTRETLTSLLKIFKIRLRFFFFLVFCIFWHANYI